jgi:hypothetical protein
MDRAKTKMASPIKLDFTLLSLKETAKRLGVSNLRLKGILQIVDADSHSTGSKQVRINRRNAGSIRRYKSRSSSATSGKAKLKHSNARKAR